MEPLDASETARERVGAVVPVLEEEDAIAGVVEGLLTNGVDHVVVVDGASRDATVERARAAGAQVVIEPRRGYGRAMMSGLAALPGDVDIVLFFDGDGCDRPELVPSVLQPIRDRTADFAMGSRLAGEREPGSLGAAQVAAGWLAGALIRLFYGARFTDMSPFRALRRETLEGLGMREETFGWNLEMQMRLAAKGVRTVELPVGQRRRVGGVSKVSGDWRAAIGAAWVIMRTFVRLALAPSSAGRR
jgi:glycosyltransferase involved in cell wall biosynthesis